MQQEPHIYFIYASPKYLCDFLFKINNNNNNFEFPIILPQDCTKNSEQIKKKWQPREFFKVFSIPLAHKPRVR